MLNYPAFDPVALQLGPVHLPWLGPLTLKLRWYGIMYVVGFLAAWWLARRRAARPGSTWTAVDVDDLIFFAVFGVILGGRLGWLAFYGRDTLAGDPSYWYKIWEGGMSFHGGALGVTIAILWFCRRNAIPLLGFADRVAVCVPIGLGLGRIANFINGELWGRVTDVPWAMIFPRGGPLPRHPSQLYQAFFEGVLLTLVLMAVWRLTDGRRRPGLLTGVFCLGYGVARIVGELFREPDAHLGYLVGHWLTMGMLLSVPVLAFGSWLIARAYRRPPVS